MKKALPEMVMFAKSEEERNHFKKLQTMDSAEELAEEVKQHVQKNQQTNEYKVAQKTRRT